MTIPITTSITSNEAAADAKDAIQNIEESQGLKVLLDTIVRRRTDLMEQISAMPPDEREVYVALGQIRGLAEIPGLIAGIIETGRTAEMRLRDQG